MADTPISLVVRDRESVIYEGKIQALSSFNERGPFDILGAHENFISVIKDSLVVHKENGETLTLKVSQGVLKAYQNTVKVYLDILPQFTAI